MFIYFDCLHKNATATTISKLILAEPSFFEDEMSIFTPP